MNDLGSEEPERDVVSNDNVVLRGGLPGASGPGGGFVSDVERGSWLEGYPRRIVESIPSSTFL
jgi:hypothetical protein